MVGELVMLAYMREANPRLSCTGSDSGRCRRQHSSPGNQKDQDGNTPLHLAAAGGHTDVIRALERTAVSVALDLSRCKQRWLDTSATCGAEGSYRSGDEAPEAEAQGGVPSACYGK